MISQIEVNSQLSIITKWCIQLLHFRYNLHGINSSWQSHVIADTSFFPGTTNTESWNLHDTISGALNQNSASDLSIISATWNLHNPITNILHYIRPLIINNIVVIVKLLRLRILFFIGIFVYPPRNMVNKKHGIYLYGLVFQENIN